ncbi:MAG TPA: hypothetical protein EYH19_01795 [Desulfocapsa sulfexigens]|nr:hypothetical protein [Desulfocapsa sulfexigens]
MALAVAFRFEGGVIFRNVRPLNALLDEFEQKDIEHVRVDTQKLKYSQWELVLVFKDRETREQYETGSIEYKPSWLPGQHTVAQRINPLKAAKRSMGKA